MPKVKEKAAFNPELLAAMVEASKVAPLDLEKAKELAAKFGKGKTWRSVVAKAVIEGIPYDSKPRVRKDGKPIASKEASVAAIEIALEVADGYFAGLEKATKVALERLRDRLAEIEDSADVEGEVE